MAKYCSKCQTKLSFRNSFVLEGKPVCKSCLRELELEVNQQKTKQVKGKKRTGTKRRHEIRNETRILNSNGDYYLEYDDKQGKNKLNIQKIQNLQTKDKRKIWMLILGLVLIIFTNLIFRYLFPFAFTGGPYRTVAEIPPEAFTVNGLQSILILFGLFLLIRYIIPFKRVVITHDDGQIELTLPKSKRKLFISQIERTIKSINQEKIENRKAEAKKTEIASESKNSDQGSPL